MSKRQIVGNIAFYLLLVAIVFVTLVGIVHTADFLKTL